MALGHRRLSIIDLAGVRQPLSTADRWLLAAEEAVDAGSNVAARLALERAGKEGLREPGQRARVDALQTRLTSSAFE